MRREACAEGVGREGREGRASISAGAGFAQRALLRVASCRLSAEWPAHVLPLRLLPSLRLLPAGTRRATCQTWSPPSFPRSTPLPTRRTRRAGAAPAGAALSGTLPRTRACRPATPASSPAPAGRSTFCGNLPSCGGGCRGVGEGGWGWTGPVALGSWARLVPARAGHELGACRLAHPRPMPPRRPPSLPVHPQRVRADQRPGGSGRRAPGGRPPHLAAASGRRRLGCGAGGGDGGPGAGPTLRPHTRAAAAAGAGPGGAGAWAGGKRCE